MSEKKKLPIFLGQDVDDSDDDPCSGCKLENFSSKCRQQPLTVFTKEGVPLPGPNDRLDLLIVGDTPSFVDNKAGKFWADEQGVGLLSKVKSLGFETFAVIPAVRCYPGGDIDHNVLTKTYKGSPKFQKETPLMRAEAAVKNCQQYVKRATMEMNPRFVMAMGPLAAKALGMEGSVKQLRAIPVRPKPGLRSANVNEGVVVTYDRFETTTNDWAFREVLRDFRRIKEVEATGFANPRGNHKTAEIKTLNTVERVKKFVNWMLTTEFDPQEVMCIDFETENLDVSTETNRLLNVGISRTCDENVAYVIPLSHPGTPFTSDELVDVYAELKRLFRSEGASFYGWCGHNTQFEVQMVKLFFNEWLGEGGGVKTLDTMVLAYVLDEARSEHFGEGCYGLEALARDYIDFRWYEVSRMKSKRDRLSSEPIDEVNEYVGFDALVTARLFNEIVERMREEGSEADLLKVAVNLYGPAIHYTVGLTISGQYADVDLLQQLRAPDSSVVKRIREIEEHFANAPEVAQALGIIQRKSHGGTGIAPVFQSSANKTFSLTSPEHRKALFADVLELEGAEESVDKKFQEKHKSVPLVALFSEYQSLSKLETSYLQPVARFLQSPNSTDGRLRPSFNLVNTRTGRLSAKNPNCYDDKTEILTRRGWVLFPELLDDDEVAQWWPNGQVDFVKPHEVVRQHYAGDMVTLKNQHVDLVVTPNHRCPIIDRKTGELKVVEARYYKEDHRQLHAGTWSGGTVSLSQAEVALVCAAQADGSWRSDVRQAMDISFSKKRKIDRLRAALQSLNVPHRESIKGKDITRFYIYACPQLQAVLDAIGKEKTFRENWLLSLDRATLDLFIQEVNHWDGCFTRNNQYTSIIKKNVDIVQIAMVLSNLRATVNKHSTPGAWAIYQTQRNYSLTTNIAKNNTTYDGMIYCVAVPSTFVVVRRNGFPCISGNTQQLPRSDSDAKKQIKSMYKATDGHVLVQLDFSQAEVRWLGIMSGDEALAEKYRRSDEIEAALLKDPHNEELKRAKKIDGDLHMSTAIVMYKLDPNIIFTDEKKAKAYRQKTKSVCFGLIYGKIAKSLAKDLNIPEEEAEEAVELWLGQFPKAAQWLIGQEEFVTQNGYVKSPFGRWRRLPEAQSNNMSVVNRAKRQSRNTPIQSAASDGCIYAACRLRDALRFSEDKGLRRVHLINTVHDSLVAEVPADPQTVKAYCELAKSIFTDRNLLMEDFGIDITVPLAVDFDIGVNWGNMRDYDFTEVGLSRALYDAEVLRAQPTGTLFEHLKGKGVLYDEAMKKDKKVA